MHEILFRGKRFDNGKWVEGYVGTAFTIDENGKVKSRHFTALDCLGWSSQVLVSDETIGLYTGLCDKNGVKIFEGDIVDVAYKVDYVGVSKYRIGLFKVIFYNGCFMKKAIPDPQLSFNDNAQRAGLYHFIPSDETEVIGNIHDNPELMKGGADNDR